MPAHKAWEDLTIADDYMFKLIMRRKRICKKMLQKILKIKIRKILYIEEEKSLKHRYTGKGVRLDVYVEDENHTIYNIEMQVRTLDDENLARRARYYQSMIDLDCLNEGTEYAKLNKTIIIFICPFKIFDGLRHIYTFEYFCADDKSLKLNDGTTKMFLSTKGALDDVDPDVDAFLKYIDGVITDNKFVKEIDDEIKKVKLIERERVSYMTFLMKLSEEREEGRGEGRNESMGIMKMLKAGHSPQDTAKKYNVPLKEVLQFATIIGV